MLETFERLLEAVTALLVAKEEHLRAAAEMLDSQTKVNRANEEAARAQADAIRYQLGQMQNQKPEAAMQAFPKPYLVPPEEA